jgi:hypothetical protein
MNNNFKILFAQTTKDDFGNWVLNDEVKNMEPIQLTMQE